LIFGLLAEMITAATYRRSEAVNLVRRVHRNTSTYILQKQASAE
jgi:hypothetical protein